MRIPFLVAFLPLVFLGCRTISTNGGGAKVQTAEVIRDIADHATRTQEAIDAAVRAIGFLPDSDIKGQLNIHTGNAKTSNKQVIDLTGKAGELAAKDASDLRDLRKQLREAKDKDSVQARLRSWSFWLGIAGVGLIVMGLAFKSLLGDWASLAIKIGIGGVALGALCVVLGKIYEVFSVVGQWLGWILVGGAGLFVLYLAIDFAYRRFKLKQTSIQALDEIGEQFGIDIDKQHHAP